MFTQCPDPPELYPTEHLSDILEKQVAGEGAPWSEKAGKNETFNILKLVLSATDHTWWCDPEGLLKMYFSKFSPVNNQNQIKHPGYQHLFHILYSTAINMVLTSKAINKFSCWRHCMIYPMIEIK